MDVEILIILATTDTRTTMNQDDNNILIWKEPLYIWGLWALTVTGLVIFFYDSLAYMVNFWGDKEEYGHAYMIPAIVAFFLWQQKDKLEQIEFSGTYKGLLLIIPGLVLFFVGELASLFVIIQYAFVLVLIGLAYAYTGDRAFRYIFIPLVMLFFMIPLPNFLYNTLSAQLQLISTQIGVAVIRLFDVSVYVEGNVIDLGTFKLQVVEACSGLRYLFPLMTLGFIAAYIFNQSMWKKLLIFVSTVPITILMNSFRIGMIGITVEYWGQEMAEGFLHDFEGWVVFMSCMALLILEMWILVKIGNDKTNLAVAFGLNFPSESPKNATVKNRSIPKPFASSLIVILVVAAAVYAIPKHEEIKPDRKQFAELPLSFETWNGRSGYMDQIYIDALKFTDYVINDYVNKDGETINFYSAYYDSQKKGASAHSPRSCIPGGGWRIASLESIPIDGVYIEDVPLIVNRLVIKKDNVQQLVYYWFQQRGRVVTSEYMMKWYLFWDSVNLHRTDGALIRLTTILEPGQDIAIADRRLQNFVKVLAPIIPEYVPGK